MGWDVWDYDMGGGYEGWDLMGFDEMECVWVDWVWMGYVWAAFHLRYLTTAGVLMGGVIPYARVLVWGTAWRVWLVDWVEDVGSSYVAPVSCLLVYSGFGSFGILRLAFAGCSTVPGFIGTAFFVFGIYWMVWMYFSSFAI
jgi:hypothetical protein